MSPCTRNPDLFFSPLVADVQKAKALCLGCPGGKKAECAELGWGNEFGVWGGMSQVDRERAEVWRVREVERRHREDATSRDREITASRRVSRVSVGV